MEQATNIAILVGAGFMVVAVLVVGWLGFTLYQKIITALDKYIDGSVNGYGDDLQDPALECDFPSGRTLDD